MFRTRALLLVALAIALLAPPHALAQTPPPGTPSVDIDGTNVLVEQWVTEANNTALEADPAAGAQRTWHFRFSNANTTAVAVTLDASTDWDGVAFAPANFTIDALAPGEQVTRSVSVVVSDDANAGPALLNAHVVVRESADAPEALGDATLATTITIETRTTQPPVVTPPGPGVDWPVVAGAGAAVIVVAAGAGIAIQRRRRRLRPIPRSAALRQQMLERQLEKAKPQEAEALREQIQQEEQVRVVSRERQILEAKRADAQRTLDLLRQRHESGQLTRLQFERMAEKKREALAAIERELSEMGE